MLYNQPLAIRFGTELLRQVDRGDQVDSFWDKLDIAVAWVRASGMAYLSDRLANFLRHGGQLSVIVGIDIQNTTREGLEALLDLEQHGRSETFVYHNEAGSIFHPKVYLFRNYEAYDIGSPQGNQIMATLDEGRHNGTTQLSKSNAESATWWRFI